MFQKAIALLAFPSNALGVAPTGRGVAAIVGAEGTCGRVLVVFVSGNIVQDSLDVVSPKVFSFCIGVGVAFGVLDVAGTVEEDGTRERGLGGGTGCFPLDIGGIGI